MFQVRPVATLGTLILLGAQVSCGGGDSSGPRLVPTSITANSSTSQNAPSGAAVADPPSVIVRDQSGAVLPGVTVTFQVTAGGGSVTGASVVTNTLGVATVGGWTLGAAAGTNTLTATVPSLPAVTFTATASAPCVVGGAHSVGGATAGTLSTSDCRLSNGAFIDYYGATVATAGTYLFNLASTAFDAVLVVYNAQGIIVGVNDDQSATTTNSVVKVILPAANMVVGTTSFDPNSVGDYSLSSSLTTATVGNCEDAFVVRGISSSQTLQSTDCPHTGGFFGDDLIIYLIAGQPVTISMSSGALDSKLELRFNDTGALVASNDDKDATTKDAQIVHTPATSGFYIINATSPTAGATGAYTITVQ